MWPERVPSPVCSFILLYFYMDYWSTNTLLGITKSLSEAVFFLCKQNREEKLCSCTLACFGGKYQKWREGTGEEL